MSFSEHKHIFLQTRCSKTRRPNDGKWIKTNCLVKVVLGFSNWTVDLVSNCSLKVRNYPVALFLFIMEVSTNGSSFGVDSLLSHRPASPHILKGDSSIEKYRSPLELSPRSDLESGCSSLSPRPESVEDAMHRHDFALESSLQHGQLPQPRTVASSFFIRDILADCNKPLAACAPYKSHEHPMPDSEHFESKIADDFMDKIHSNSSSDNEYKGKLYYLTVRKTS